MSVNTKIEWTDHTFNPWWGCIKVSPACDHCYAESFSKRTGHQVWGKDAPRRFFSDAHWAEPIKWNSLAAAAGQRHRVFCGSMCDIMEDRPELVPHRVRLFNLIAETPNLDWLLLTKRPQNFRKFLPWGDAPMPWPNVWLMTTVESQQYLWRADELVRVPAVIHGISYEPALGPIYFRDLIGQLDWVIAGGESGGGARASHPDWFRTVRDDCVKAGVPFFFKQHGAWVSVSEVAGKGKHYSFPDGATVRRIGKKAAGALLDGKEWKQFPQVRGFV